MTKILKITHETSYHYDEPVPFALQQLRLRPKSRRHQKVIDWTVTVQGGIPQVRFTDEHDNDVDLISFAPGMTDIVIRSEGQVELEDNHGIVGRHTGFVPLWLYKRSTPLTRTGPQVRALLGALDRPEDPLDLLHALSEHIRDRVPYSTDQAEPDLTAEQILTLGHGVCQDHAHIFLAATRHLGLPARYVSGYLMMDDRTDQDASHAWAEAHVEGLGWVGFDISNGISPDQRYVRVATGCDYLSAAPISGMRYGSGSENMLVRLRVEQQ
jgi:transglutaminase-like putative cysteine protease